MKKKSLYNIAMERKNKISEIQEQIVITVMIVQINIFLPLFLVIFLKAFFIMYINILLSFVH